jgi:WD40 repeat protein
MKANVRRIAQQAACVAASLLGLLMSPLSAQEPALRATLKGHTRTVFSVAYSPDGMTLASASEDRTIKLWDVATGAEKLTLKGHTDAVGSIAFSPDGKTLASGSQDQTIKLWDTASGQEKATLKGHSNRVFSVAFSRDGKILASGSDDQTIRLWDLTRGKEQAAFRGNTLSVYSVAFAPDGKTLAAGSHDREVKLFDVATGKVRTTLQGHTALVFSVAFSPDGKSLASASQDNTVKFWDTATGKERATFKGHTGYALSVSYSPDGKTLASGSFDQSIKLWDVSTGKEQTTLQGHSAPVWGVAFSPDGKSLASASGDKTIKLWTVKASKPVKELILPGESFLVEGRPAFVLLPPEKKRSKPQPWVLYAPTLPGLPDQHEKWMHEQFLAAGIAVAGIDIGESYGSPRGRELFTAFHREMTTKRGFAEKPCLLGRSRGGLWVTSWAADHPDKVAGIAGIYPVFDLRTYPGLATAAPAYGLKSKELEERLAEFNPIERVGILAKARVPTLLIHGDEDKVVPLRENSAEFVTRCKAHGAEGIVKLIIAKGQGHNYWEGFFRCKELVDFVITHAKAGQEAKEKQRD